MKNRLRSILLFMVGGLLYQGGRVLFGMKPTWDTFAQITAIGIVVLLIVGLIPTRK